jgi:hypothetical protein
VPPGPMRTVGTTAPAQVFTGQAGADEVPTVPTVPAPAAPQRTRRLDSLSGWFPRFRFLGFSAGRHSPPAGQAQGPQRRHVAEETSPFPGSGIPWTVAARRSARIEQSGAAQEAKAGAPPGQRPSVSGCGFARGTRSAGTVWAVQSRPLPGQRPQQRADQRASGSPATARSSCPRRTAVGSSLTGQAPISLGGGRGASVYAGREGVFRKNRRRRYPWGRLPPG